MSHVRLKILLFVTCISFCTWMGLAKLFDLGPFTFLDHAAKVLAAPVFASIYDDDLKAVKKIVESYQVGDKRLLSSPPSESWKNIETKVPGFRFLGAKEGSEFRLEAPFVYERMDSSTLAEFREKCSLDRVISGPGDEYDAMLRLGAWLGTRWDHGSDPVPGGRRVCEPVRVISAGENGAKFWCETAARTAVEAATAVGWTARLLTASSDGYTWQHGVAEFWSNQYGKWFVLDTDFNCVYEYEGVPLSGFELCHRGNELQNSGKLVVRAIAPPKKSLPKIDLIPYYSYIHIDMRNDWCSRPLAEGSPAGGDLSTWWTPRPSLHRVLTAKRRVDDPALFDWAVNWVSIYALDAKSDPEGRTSLEIGLAGYSPTFQAFEVSFDGGGWHRVEQPRYVLSADPGDHVVRARLLTISRYTGPVSEVSFHVSSAPGNPAADKSSLHGLR
jgi:hypothetical protein